MMNTLAALSASMNSNSLIAVGAIIVLGGVAQWLAWRLRLPSILLLLLFGFLAGPVMHIVRTDELFGPLLRPFVSISVGFILFEGGLSLNFRELAGTARVMWSLVTIGVLVTSIVAAAAARALLGFEVPLAILFGAILSVTGPTVILPLLQHVRPCGPVAGILRWEGIIIDPIGALLAVFVFEGIITHQSSDAVALVAMGVLKIIVVGGGLGCAAAIWLMLAIRRYWLPEFLQSSVTLVLVSAALVVSNLVQAESGLLAATVMGIFLGNQRSADVRHIADFKENLRLLLVSTLFIVLSARLTPDDLQSIGWEGLTFIAILVLVARPLGVLLCTLGSSLKRSERIFLMWMAPRGIVAASVASVFAFDLEQRGFVQARQLVPVTFATIVATVLIYGLTSAPLARLLHLSEKNPQGILILGAHALGRAMAAALVACRIKVLLVDSNPANAATSRLAGLPTYLGSILGERTLDELDLAGIGSFVAMTPNDPINVLAGQRFIRFFGASNIYQLFPKTSGRGTKEMHKHLHGRLLFAPDAHFDPLDRRIQRGDIIKTTTLSDNFNFADFKKKYGPDALPLFLIGEDGKLIICTTDRPVEPRAGQKIIALVQPTSAAENEASGSV